MEEHLSGRMSDQLPIPLLAPDRDEKEGITLEFEGGSQCVI